MQVTNTAGSLQAQQSNAISFSNSLPLTLYRDPPNGPVTLQELETFAVDRLQLLRRFEQIRANGGKVSDHRIQMVFAETRFRESDQAGNETARKLPGEAFRRKDTISHFTLRLAFCHTEELRVWLRRMESELFRFRFDSASPEEQRKLLEEHNLHFDECPTDELRRVESMLLQTPTYQKGSLVYKVGFSQALELIGRRRVYVNRGVAYIPRQELVSLISTSFRSFLSLSLMTALHAILAKRHDSRLDNLLTNLSVGELGPGYKSNTVAGSVKPEDLAALAESSFPLCMQSLYEGLIRDSHLRYGGRQQLGLFLKGIGLSLDHALYFFRTVFSKKSSAKNFDKAYAYNIRHNYGKEGKRQDYVPLSCHMIISGAAPSEGDHHGCPFRHFDEGRLAAKLRLRKVKEFQIETMISLVKDKHYQLACREYFKATHGGELGAKVGNHPNEYFEESMDMLNKKDTGRAET